MEAVILADSVPRLSPGTVIEEKAGTKNITRFRAFNPLYSSFSLLNFTGSRVANLINGHNSIQDIAESLSRQFDVGIDRTLPDVLKLVDKLKKHKLIYLKGELTPEVVETTGTNAPGEIWFHITNRCNLRCKTCFKDAGDAYPQEMPLAKLLSLIDEMTALDAGRVIVSGGEPLMRDDALDIVSYLVQSERRVLLITNGTLINEAIANRLGEIKPQMVQVSLDGSQAEINDRIRGAGSYDRTIRAVRLLLDQGLDVRLYPTVTRWNIHDLPNMKKLVLELRPGFDHLSFAKFVGIGRGSRNEDELEISPEEFYKIFCSLPVSVYSTPQILDKLAAAREAQDLNDFVPDRIAYGARKVNCGIASGTFSIDADGSVYPCQWLHMKEFLSGNVFEQTLEEIYYGSKVFAQCRSIRVDSEVSSCCACSYRYFCGGGCRARALFKNGSLLGEDPDCFYLRKFFEKGFWAENQFTLGEDIESQLDENYRESCGNRPPCGDESAGTADSQV